MSNLCIFSLHVHPQFTHAGAHILILVAWSRVTRRRRPSCFRQQSVAVKNTARDVVHLLIQLRGSTRDFQVGHRRRHQTGPRQPAAFVQTVFQLVWEKGRVQMKLGTI